MSHADIWTAMPLLILAAGALVVLLCGAAHPGRYTGVVAGVVLAGAALWVLQPPPLAAHSHLGISTTPFGRFFTVLFCLTAIVTLFFSHSYNRDREIEGEEYPATILFGALGMVALASATNLLVLFLALEALTFAFYILVAIDLRQAESAEAGLKYLLQGAVAAAFIAFGIALIYAGSGTLQLNGAMQWRGAEGGVNPYLAAGWGFLLLGLAFKVSLVPAHLWTPDVYQGAPTPVVAFLSTGSKGAAFAAFLLLIMGGENGSLLRSPLWVLALLSMVLGNLTALRQNNLKRMLAYSSIAQMGYVTLSLLTLSRDGYRGVVFYVVAYTVMNLAAFGAISSLSRGGGMETLQDYRGIAFARPLQGGVLALAMFALAGIPPTAGFLGKFIIFSAALRGGEAVLAVIGILTAAASVYYYLRVVVNLYMESAGPAMPPVRATPSEWIGLGGCAALIIILGVYPAPLLNLLALVIP